MTDTSDQCPNCGAAMTITGSPGSYETPVAEHVVDGLACVERQRDQLKAENERLSGELERLLDDAEVRASDLASALGWDRKGGTFVEQIKRLREELTGARQQLVMCTSQVDETQLPPLGEAAEAEKEQGHA